MDIINRIQSHLRELAKSHTQAEIAKMTGVSQQHIGRLLSSKNGLYITSRIELCTLLKMFPGMEIRFPWEKTGESIQQHHNGQAIAVNNGTVNNSTVNGADATWDAFRSRATDAIIDLDIPSDAMKKVLKTLKDLQSV